MVKQLLEAVLDGGIQSTNFFNGRLLAAEDLQVEQAAVRQTQQQLGQALGTGVVWGLDVHLTCDGANCTQPSVSVGAGLALNPQGQACGLSDTVEVALTLPPPPRPGEGGSFGDCTPTRLGTGIGAYILLMAPASGYQGRAPMSGLGSGGRITSCGSRYRVDGVTFRLVRLDPAGLPGISAETQAALAALLTRRDPPTSPIPPATALLCNWLAHICYGSEALATLRRDPFGTDGGNLDTQYSALAALLLADPAACATPLDSQTASRYLTSCDVPLALFWWNADGVRFLDTWAVRRRPSPAAGPWPVLAGARRRREAEAMLFQFQDQIETLRTRVVRPDLLVATRYFRYLPPVGLLPLASVDGPSGFDYQAFFQGMTVNEPVFVEGARVETLFRDYLSYPAIDLASQEMIRLYRVRENMQWIDSGPLHPPAPCLIFTNGHIPDHGAAHYDLSRWSYSNFS